MEHENHGWETETEDDKQGFGRRLPHMTRHPVCRSRLVRFPTANGT